MENYKLGFMDASDEKRMQRDHTGRALPGRERGSHTNKNNETKTIKDRKSPRLDRGAREARGGDGSGKLRFNDHSLENEPMRTQSQ